MRVALALLCATACGNARREWPVVQVIGESSRVRAEDGPPITSAWFDGARISLVAARGETLGLLVYQRTASPVTLDIAGARAFSVESYRVAHPSTDMYGGSQGAGTYADGLSVTTGAVSTNPAYFEIAVPRDAAPGAVTGVLRAGTRSIPIALTISRAALPELKPSVWAYMDAREIGDGEADCRALFRSYGAWLTPDIPLKEWEARRASVADMPDVPVIISSDPEAARQDVTAWIMLTAGTGQVPFSIPIDEPHTPADRARMSTLADAVRKAGGGGDRFHLAVTDSPQPIYGDAIDLYISPEAAHLAGDRFPRWTYNGAPPRAGSLVLDAASPGMRTWGWIGWRWKIPVWYVWDALYWHDRHNKQHQVALVPASDTVSFDDGDDRGNFDGVLALPDAHRRCMPTLRLASLRRGLQDRQLLDLASACDPAATAAIAATLVPKALGDAPLHGTPSWPLDDAAWELARRDVLKIAERCAK